MKKRTDFVIYNFGVYFLKGGMAVINTAVRIYLVETCSINLEKTELFNAERL